MLAKITKILKSKYWPRYGQNKSQNLSWPLIEPYYLREIFHVELFWAVFALVKPPCTQNQVLKSSANWSPLNSESKTTSSFFFTNILIVKKGSKGSKGNKKRLQMTVHYCIAIHNFTYTFVVTAMAPPNKTFSAAAGSAYAQERGIKSYFKKVAPKAKQGQPPKKKYRTNATATSLLTMTTTPDKATTQPGSSNEFLSEWCL